ncbi:MAG: Eco57I restriction-modification methylase domain-containing protein, partial [Gemmatimonadaceae bacterium]
LNTRPSRRAAAARALGAIPFLNGGLFARSIVEKRARLRFPDDAIGAFLDEVLTRYRFTAREETTDWSEVAIDPEMLGKAFESLMAASSRRGSGSYYTPQALVAHVSESALQHALGQSESDRIVVSALLRGERVPPGSAVTHLRQRLAGVRVLDPACGSGAFLVHALELIADLHVALGDERPRDVLRRSVLAGAIFGVDLNPIAVWLCELRLWLSCVVDSTEQDVQRVPPLPNLDRNIRVGDALLGDGFEPTFIPTPSTAPLARLRLRYARATGRRKIALARTLDREVQRFVAAGLRNELAALKARRHALITATRGRDLFGARRGALPAEQQQLATDRARARELRLRLRSLDSAASLPFSFPSHFADVLDRGGFDVVLGNPPWVRPHHVGPAMREALRRRFTVLREAAWRRGSELAGARSGRVFGGQPDLAAAFVERGLDLLRQGGTLALLVPVKLWKSLAGGGVRRLLFERAVVRAVEDWSDAPAVFDAAVYPSLIVANRQAGMPNGVELTLHRRDLAIRWHAPRQTVPFDQSTGSPWLLLPPDARAAFERLAKTGIPLHEAAIGRITLGVKTGCNAAFIIGADDDPVEPSLLRPLLRGEDVAAWTSPPSRQRIIWTHGRSGQPLERLPPLAQMHFAEHRYALEQRSDARGTKWWALFRTEGARHDTARVVWPDLARVPRAAVLRAGDPTVPLNTCYVVRCKDEADALTLAAVLNSPLAAAWLGAIAEPARGGYRRLFAWTVSLLPVPDDWSRARDVLGSLGSLAVQGHTITPADLFEAACQAYRLRRASVTALCDWMRGT